MITYTKSDNIISKPLRPVSLSCIHSLRKFVAHRSYATANCFGPTFPQYAVRTPIHLRCRSSDGTCLA